MIATRSGPALHVVTTQLDGVRIVEPRHFHDDRGWFAELWRADRYADIGIGSSFVQDNVSVSHRDVIRGLHLQYPHTQAKLVSVLRGEVFDVVVDVRRGSPTYGRWEGVALSETNGRQLFVPEGYAHGFAVTSDEAVVMYKCSAFYNPTAEHVVRWDDPTIGVRWPTNAPTLSPKDRAGRLLADFADDELPTFGSSPS